MAGVDHSADRGAGNRTTGAIALVTGANKGIGFETARQLGALGDTVWIGCRNPQLGRAAAEALGAEGADIRFVLLDVLDDHSVSIAVQMIRDAHGRLDVLVNNAGILGNAPTLPREEAVDNIRRVFETNVFGVIRVTQGFVPLLALSTDAQVAMVSSGLASLSLMSDPASRVHATNILGYVSSKTALNAVTVSFAKDLATVGIRVNSIDPGYTATDLNGGSGQRTVDRAAASIVAALKREGVAPITGAFLYDGQPVPW